MREQYFAYDRVIMSRFGGGLRLPQPILGQALCLGTGCWTRRATLFGRRAEFERSGARNLELTILLLLLRTPG